MLKRRLIAMLLCIAMIGSMTVYAVGDDTTCTCGTENDVHAEDCALLAEPETEPEPVCTCNTENDEHTSECALYVAPVTEPEVTEPVIDPDCTCGTTEPSSHAETCPCFEYSVVKCICGAGIGTHDTDCPLYKAPTFFEKIMAAESVEDMYIAFCADQEQAYSLSVEQIDKLIARATELKDTIGDPTEEYEEFVMTLEYIKGEVELKNTDMLYAGLSGYIVFDLYYGDVTITDKTYSGYDLNGNSISASHSSANKYYICQSNGSNTPRDATTGIPNYNRVTYGGKSWGNYITNNTDVLGVINAWNTAAAIVGRSETPATMKLNDNVVKDNPDVTVSQHHRIIIESAETTSTSFDVTIDNVWSGFQNDDCRDANGNFYAGAQINDGPHYRKSGGLTFRPNNTTTTATIRLKGDNRFGNVHYEAGSGAGGSTDSDVIDSRIRQLFFCNADESSNPGTMTVGNLRGDVGENHFDSVIGGANNPNYVPGLVFQGGTIYAGATVLDNCTAIGGGGCGFGGITIEGGTITAVTATNGAAIGGGIGDGSNGGATDILISGGTVYAYNKGLAIEGTRESRGEAGTTAGETVYVVMPAVAIGSGSSRRQWTVPAKIEITGGTVYAQSVGGTAIGAGSSNNFDAADADIKISGSAVVTAKSVGGTVTAIHEYDQGAFPTYVGKTETVSASNAIGGGTAGIPFRYETSSLLYAQGNGGDCVLTISDNAKIYAGSIGGGGVSDIKNSTDTAPRPNTVGKIGSAQVTISGGTTQGQVIMAKGAEMDCFFDMTGGTIDNSTKDDSFVFLKENGGAVYVENGNAKMSGGTIKNCDDAVDGGVFYVVGGDVEISGNSVIEHNKARYGGVAYVSKGNFTMLGGTIQENDATSDGGAVYVTDGNFNMISGVMQNNTAAGYGGGAFAHGGNITIGVKDCAGTDDNHTVTHPTLAHPVVSDNVADFGGGLAVDGGVVDIYCGRIVTNISDNNGTGMNIFMFDSDTTDNKSGVINHIGGTVGDPNNHGMVVIGGELNVPYKEGMLTINIKYHDNVETLTFEVWVGEAPNEYYLNLPYCPQKWESEQNGRGLTFVGWTHDTETKAPPVQENVDLSFIRSKDDYKALGDPVKIRQVDWKFDEEKQKYYIDFYAVWAPRENNITYTYSLDNLNIVSEADGKTIFPTTSPQKYSYDLNSYDLVIPEPTRPGYTFTGWKMYAADEKISNWGKDATMYEPTLISQIQDVTWKKDKNNNDVVGTIDVLQNFGDIVMVAVFEPQFADLQIQKTGYNAYSSVDENQAFLFHVEGTPYDTNQSEVDMIVTVYGTVSGQDQVQVKHLPVGDYTVTELTDWSWRYNVANNGITLTNAESTDMTTESVTFALTNTDAATVAEFNNSRTTRTWLSGDSWCKNWWNETGITETNSSGGNTGAGEGA